MPSCKVLFSSLGKTVVVEKGTSLLDAAREANITINSICGGDGICGRCKMIVKEGTVRWRVSSLLTRDEIQQGVVLACQSSVTGDVVVEIPEETRARERITVDKAAERFKAIRPGVPQREFKKSPLVSKVFLQLDEPSLDNSLADCQRMQRMVEKSTGFSSMQTGLKIIRRMSEVLRESSFGITATIGKRRNITEIMDIEAGDTSARNYLAVVDVGTSTIVLHLINAIDTSMVDAQACFNSQAIYGREVTSRIIASEKKGPEQLQKALVDDINRLVSNVATKNSVNLRDITAVVCAGNTAMIHFLLGLPTWAIRRKPFVAVTVEPPPFRAAEVGLKINPRGLLFALPGISSWVGSDLTAGILATGLNEMEEIGMLIDVGTNGEIILGNKDWLVACSASAGPALEGASVECGMLSEAGAIESAHLEEGEIRCKVIGGGKPKGICGSGIIDIMAALLDMKVINRSGRFVEQSDARVVKVSDEHRYVIRHGKEQGLEGAVYITQTDIENIITAKAAIFAAAKILIDRLELKFSDIKTLFIAGGFGSYINRENAVKIGLLPDIPIANIRYVGNTSIWGAKLAALSEEACDSLSNIRRRTTYYDLLGSPDYVDQFTQAMFLPHTNIELFPSLLRERKNGTT